MLCTCGSGWCHMRTPVSEALRDESSLESNNSSCCYAINYIRTEGSSLEEKQGRLSSIIIFSFLLILLLRMRHMVGWFDCLKLACETQMVHQVTCQTWFESACFFSHSFQVHFCVKHHLATWYVSGKKNTAGIQTRITDIKNTKLITNNNISTRWDRILVQMQRTWPEIGK